MAMKKWFLILILSGCASVKHQDVNVAKITEYGIYHDGKSISTLNLPQSNTGVLTITDNSQQLIKSTNKIPAVVGTTFGYCYDIHSKEKTITVTRKLIHPKIHKPDGTISTGYEYQRTLDVENGVASYCTNYTLEYEWEVVEGEWKFSIIHSGKEIFNQTFELYK